MHLRSLDTAIMSDRVLPSQRETIQKVKENEETKAIIRFHVVVDDIKTTQLNIDDFDGACSDKIINRRVSELHDLKRALMQHTIKCEALQ